MARKSVKVPDEIKDLVREVRDKESGGGKSPAGVTGPSGIKWDVPKEEFIPFFDKRKSYELTGYRPITETEGLDFDPSWFTEARDTYLRTGKYCGYRMFSKPYNDFWDEEYKRCREGYTRNGYTLTGPNYYYLNYYQLPNIDVAVTGSGRSQIFPKFLVFQYEFFHYFEICRREGKDVCLMKSRGIGFSEINAAICACMYNCFRNSRCMITASLSNHLEKSLDKVWGALSFANENTQGGMAKLRQVKDTQLLKRASTRVVDANGMPSETGWMAQIEGVVAETDAKIRGDRIDLLVFEEAGSNRVLEKSYIKGKALIYIGGKKFGIRLAGGTGGDKGAALEGLRKMYYDPKGFDILPFYHNYMADGSWVYTGYFIPSYIGAVTEFGRDVNGKTRRLLDNRGYCLWQNYKEQLDADRDSLANNPKGLVDYSAEYCYTAEEAFALEGENKFNKVRIAEQLANIRALKKCPKIERGYIEYRYKDEAKPTIDGFKWIPNNNSPLQILEHPIWTLPPVKDEEGNIIWRPPKERIRDMYVVGIDGIDIGSGQTSEATKDPSDFCLVVYKRVYGTSEPQFVALYKDRPHDVRESYKIAIKIAQYYNAMINIEATRQGIIPFARGQRLLNWFMKRPRATLADAVRNTNKQYGTPATPAIIDHQTDLIADYVNDYCHLIWFEKMLEELNQYTDEHKRKFDIVASMAMALLADEELQGVVPKTVEEVRGSWRDIGYYTDEYGRRHYGVIPGNDNQIRINNNFGQQYEDFGPRTSDSRLYQGVI